MNEEKIKNIPSLPGVYIMKNKRKNVIYVGKAKNLKKRVKSYFNKTNLDPKTQVLIKNIDDIECLITKTELEALILESNLIKKYSPRYNVILKDDKSYPYIMLDLGEKFPKLQVVRRLNFNKKKSTQVFYGPFPQAISLKESIRFINKFFKLRTCGDHKMKNRTRPCINFDIGLCSGACLGLVSEENYKKQVDQAALLLKGRVDELIKVLKDKMKEASVDMNFERAAEIRDRIKDLKCLTEKQVVNQVSARDIDVFAHEQNEEKILIYNLFVRQGMVLGGASNIINVKHGSHLDNLSLENIYDAFLNQYYINKYIPDNIVIPVKPKSSNLLEQLLSTKNNKKVKIIIPQKGNNLKLINIAFENAKKSFELKIQKTVELKTILNEIKHKLDLDMIPNVIECLDVSNFGGAFPVASKVVFRDGEFDKKSYRHYKIKGNFNGEQNDFAMLGEVVQRAYIDNNDVPDLILVDGGVGQLKTVYSALSKIGKSVKCASIAKARTEKDFKNEEITRSHDRIYLPGRKNPAAFRPDSAALKLLSKIRDEAHRFAITFNRKLVRKDFIS